MESKESNRALGEALTMLLDAVNRAISHLRHFGRPIPWELVGELSKALDRLSPLDNIQPPTKGH